MEKKRAGGGGGREEEIHETSIRFARTHTRDADYYNKSPSALFGRPGARYAFVHPVHSRCFSIYICRASCTERRTRHRQWPNGDVEPFSLSLSSFFLSPGLAVLGWWRESGKAFRLNRMFAIGYESYGSVGIINSGINISSS